MKLRFTYENNDEHLNFEKFWKEESGAFDNTNKAHVTFMLIALQKELNLDTYGVAKLESTIKSELPFFAKTRRIAKDWLTREFMY